MAADGPVLYVTYHLFCSGIAGTNGLALYSAAGSRGAGGLTPCRVCSGERVEISLSALHILSFWSMRSKHGLRSGPQETVPPETLILMQFTPSGQGNQWPTFLFGNGWWLFLF